MNVNEMWDALLEMGASEETLQVVTSINGYNEEAMHDILYALFGENSFDCDEEEEEV